MPHSNHDGPVRTSIVYGEPITVYGRTLTPVAKVTSSGGHQGTIRECRVEGYGWAFSSLKPLHIIEQQNGEVYKIPIPDKTGELLTKIAILSTLVAVVSMILILIGYIRRI